MRVHHTRKLSTDFCEILAGFVRVILFYLRMHESNTAALKLVHKQI